MATSNSITMASMLVDQPPEAPLGRLGVGARAPLGGKQPRVAQGHRRLVGERLQQPLRSASTPRPRPAATPSAPIGLAVDQQRGGHDRPESRIPSSRARSSRRIDDGRILEHVGRGQRPALQHGAAGQARRRGPARAARCARRGWPANASATSSPVSAVSSVDRGLTSAQQREHGVGDELGDHRGVERVGQRLGHRGQRLGLAPPPLTVSVESRALHGERDLGGQGAERVHRLRARARRRSARRPRARPPGRTAQ